MSLITDATTTECRGANRFFLFETYFGSTVTAPRAGQRSPRDDFSSSLEEEGRRIELNFEWSTRHNGWLVGRL